MSPQYQRPGASVPIAVNDVVLITTPDGTNHPAGCGCGCGGNGDAAGEGDFETLAMAEGVGEDSSGGESEFSCLDETVHGGAVVGDDLWRKCRL